MKKKIFLFTIIFMFVFMSILFASTAKIVTRVDKALSTISKWIVKISTPAAAVAIGSGLLMKKFSFGDEEKKTY